MREKPQKWNVSEDGPNPDGTLTDPSLELRISGVSLAMGPLNRDLYILRKMKRLKRRTKTSFSSGVTNTEEYRYSTVL